MDSNMECRLRASRRKSRIQRGSTLTGYSLVVAAFAVVSLGAVAGLSSSSEDFLEDTGDAIGTPRKSVYELTDGTSGGATGTGFNNGGTTPSTVSMEDLTENLSAAVNIQGNMVPHPTHGGLGIPNSDPLNGSPPYNNPLDPSQGSFELTFTVETAAYYNIEATVFAPNGSDNSFWVIVPDHLNPVPNSVHEVQWHTPQNSSTPVTDLVQHGSVIGNANQYWFNPGTVTIQFRVREPGTFLQSPVNLIQVNA